MLGRVQREGESHRRIVFRHSGCSQHMRSVPLSPRRTSVAEADSSLVSKATTCIATDYFCKDGRKISVGDCALFKPPHDSPPFIGLIRWLTISEENNLQLGVNWLYRPAEVKLGKGILLDAAPNELFYSFHRDEIPAASLLHPCKVAFLPKGVELPSGISSFVCQRVYDISNKCLWWLTDQDYIDERQEEVDDLLIKTRAEMDGTVAPGGRSPKPTSNLMLASQLKPGSDNLQNSLASIPSQTKGKKRERGDQSCDPVKRERYSKADDSDSCLVKSESSLRSEIAKITEKGGLVDSELVEKLVQLMQPDRAEKKMDLNSRSMLASIIAATDRFDCLTRFVQLKGLPVLDEWLQDVHKGKTGDGSNSKDADKSCEEFLFILLCALDKLPVNLHALQTSTIGRSVNHLRSHKNLEIQKKARSLVDTWKKRVEDEMNIIDAKSASTQGASWPAKSRIPEAHGGRNSGISSDVALKSSVTQVSASKTASIKASPGETATKSASLSPGPIKSASSPASGKEGQFRTTAGSASDAPLSTWEDKSSSSSQSHNYSQSFSVKEDARSSTAGSMSVNKVTSGPSRHRKSINGFPGTSASGSPKETVSGRYSSMHRNATQEKFSVSYLMTEKAFDVPILEGSSHKLIVKIPNRGRSPAHSVSGGSFEDPSIMSSRASSPVLSDRHEHSDRSSKEKANAFRANIISDVNAESWQSNDLKDLQAGSDEGDGSPAALPDEERNRTVEDSKKVPEVSKVTSSSGKDLKSGKLHEASFCSMNALIESCAKYSESSTPISLGDDIGMNLLASVAAGEMCKSDVSPADSPQGSTPAMEEMSFGDDAKSIQSSGDNLALDLHQANVGADGEYEKVVLPGTNSRSKDGICLSKQASAELPLDRKVATVSAEEAMETTVDCTEMIEKSKEITSSISFLPREKGVRERERDQCKQVCDEKGVRSTADGIPDAKLGGSDSLLNEVKVSNVLCRTEDVNQRIEESSQNQSTENGCMEDVNETLNAGAHMEQKPAILADEEAVQPTVSRKDLVPETMDETRVGEAVLDKETSQVSATENQNLTGFGSSATDCGGDCVKADVQNKEGTESSVSEFPANESVVMESQKEKREVDFGDPTSNDKVDEKEDYKSTVADSTSVSTGGAPATDSKMNFDLNEGLIGDEGKYGESVILGPSASISNAHLSNPSNTTISSCSSSIPASITVAAAAKGPFVPPVDLLRNKSELGWKGSAATSAFRPAEPRKVVQVLLGPSNISPPHDPRSKSCRPLLDIDLNVPDERLLEDMGCRDSSGEAGSCREHSINHGKLRNELTGSAPGRGSGGLDLDLNRVDDANDMMQYPVISSRILEAPVVSIKTLSSSSLPSGEVRRDFDLNNGPGVDDVPAEQSSFNPQGRASTLTIQSQLPNAGVRPNDVEAGNFSTWFPAGNSFSSVTIPSVIPDRGEQPFPLIAPGAPQRILGLSGGNHFPPDIYRGSVLSSSPAVPFPSGPFPYQMFPFGSSLPLPSATFSVGSAPYLDSTSGGRLFNPTMNSQFLGPVSAVSSQYTRPYVVSLPDGVNSGVVDNSRKWSRQGLDLNAGPGALDVVEGREESLLPRQHAVTSSQALAEEQARMYPVAGGLLKRKDPEGGWDGESFRYKQPSWQ